MAMTYPLGPSVLGNPGEAVTLGGGAPRWGPLLGSWGLTRSRGEPLESFESWRKSPIGASVPEC
jgi:hypothetical protein